MWRVQGLFGRVLQRCQGSSTLRLPQSHHVEDEVINSTAVPALSNPHRSFDSSSQREEDGERTRKQRTFQSSYSELPHYTALDAVGWGAATVLFMQICRRVHSQLSTGPDPSPAPGALTTPGAIQKCGYRILLEILSRRDVLPRGRSVSCLEGAPERQSRAQSPHSSSSSSSDSGHSSSEHGHPSAISSLFVQQRALSEQDLFTTEDPSLSPSSSEEKEDKHNEHRNSEKNESNNQLPDEEALTAAALNLRGVEETSVPVVLNIIGLESAKSGNYEEAFACFLAAAQRGYTKAQYNTAVCYEKGRGVGQDKEKALCYYKLAAGGGHKEAQYRYAKLLLTTRWQQSSEEFETAISLLEQSAAAGLTKAQVCLASIYSQDPGKYGCKFIDYLKMAAESNVRSLLTSLSDDTALFLLAECYESGVGVEQNLSTADRLYKRAAQAGNKQAKMLLTPPDVSSKAHGATLRSIRSAPCFSAVDSQIKRTPSPLAVVPPVSTPHAAALPVLSHSCSTGSLCTLRASTPFHLLTPHTHRGGCQWTVGIG